MSSALRPLHRLPPAEPPHNVGGTSGEIAVAGHAHLCDHGQWPAIRDPVFPDRMTPCQNMGFFNTLTQDPPDYLFAAKNLGAIRRRFRVAQYAACVSAVRSSLSRRCHWLNGAVCRFGNAAGRQGL